MQLKMRADLSYLSQSAISRSDPKGFTLLELAIVIAVIAMLAAFAFANYKSYLHKANRELLKQVLLANAVRMEEYYSKFGRYAASDNLWPTEVIESEFKLGSQVIYIINFSPINSIAQSGQDFKLCAIPMSATVQADDGAGTICIDQEGVITENNIDIN